MLINTTNLKEGEYRLEMPYDSFWKYSQIITDTLTEMKTLNRIKDLNIKPHSTDKKYLIQHGDRIDNLAWKFYQNQSYFWVIYMYNIEVIGKNIFDLPAGEYLIYPDKSRLSVI